MYCSNCGKENDDGVAFCSQCGKSPTGMAVADKEPMMVTGFTVDLIRNCFPWVFAAMFWITVIGSMIGGAKAAQGIYTVMSTTYSIMSKSDYSGNEAGAFGAMIIGGLIGLVSGFLVAVYVNGVVATLLTMDKNLQYLADKEKAKA